MRLLVPNLLQCHGRSICVIDPKGELAAMTAPYRRKLGPVVIINPFDTVRREFAGYDDLRSAGYNPLATLDPSSPSFNSDAGLLGEALIKNDGGDAHWSDSARALVSAIIMYVTIEAKAQGTAPTMRRVRELLCEASDEAHKGNNFEGAGIPKRAGEMMESSVAGLRNKASQFTDWNREIQSITSVAKRQTEPFDDDEIAADLEKGSFDFRDMKRKPVTVYIILPPEMMDRHSRWLRLLLSSAINGVLRARRPGEPRCLFIMDEFFALGRLPIVETVWNLVRGYGVQLMPVLQSLTQLQSLYGEKEAETFLSAAGVISSFTPNDMTTAEWLSRRAGQRTERAASMSVGQNTGGSGNAGTSYSEIGVPVFRPTDLFGMNAGFSINFFSGLAHHVPAYVPAYWEIRECVERVRKNPYRI